MKISSRIAPPNSLLLLLDEEYGEIPEAMAGGLIAATASCVAVGTASESDGETEIAICGKGEILFERAILAFDGCIVTPNRKISLSTIFGDLVIGANVLSERSDLKIWVNHETEPDMIYICIDELQSCWLPNDPC